MSYEQNWVSLFKSNVNALIHMKIFIHAINLIQINIKMRYTFAYQICKNFKITLMFGRGIKHALGAVGV